MHKNFFELKVKGENEKAHYSCLVNKYDRHGYKMRSRILIITNLKFYLLDDKKLTVKEAIPLQSIMSIITSSKKDGIFIVKVPIEKKEKVCRMNLLIGSILYFRILGRFDLGIQSSSD